MGAVPYHGSGLEIEEFRDEADELMCVRLPKPFYEVRVWYEDSSQTTDTEVRDQLARDSVGSTR